MNSETEPKIPDSVWGHVPRMFDNSVWDLKLSTARFISICTFRMTEPFEARSSVVRTAWCRHLRKSRETMLLPSAGPRSFSESASQGG